MNENKCRKRPVLLRLAILFWLIIPVAAARADVRSEIERMFAGQALLAFGTAVDLDRLRPAYETQAFAPVWVTDNGAAKSALALLITIGNAAEDGLEPGAYLSGVPTGWKSCSPMRSSTWPATCIPAAPRRLSARPIS